MVLACVHAELWLARIVVMSSCCCLSLSAWCASLDAACLSLVPATPPATVSAPTSAKVASVGAAAAAAQEPDARTAWSASLCCLLPSVAVCFLLSRFRGGLLDVPKSCTVGHVMFESIFACTRPRIALHRESASSANSTPEQRTNHLLLQDPLILRLIWLCQRDAHPTALGCWVK